MVHLCIAAHIRLNAMLEQLVTPPRIRANPGIGRRRSYAKPRLRNAVKQRPMEQRRTHPHAITWVRAARWGVSPLNPRSDVAQLPH